MAWDRAIDLFVNLGSSPEFVLLAGKSTWQPGERPLLISGDKHLVRVWLLQASAPGQIPSLQTLADGDILILAGKLKASASTLLFSAMGFMLEAAGGSHYEAELDLTPTVLRDAFGDESALLCTCEIEVQNAANTLRRTRQFPVRINKGVYNDESEPVPAEPAYPSADALLLRVPTDGAYRVNHTVDGVFWQLKNKTTGKWHTIWVDGADGEEVFAIGPGED
jgi:hypothetical protein